MTFGAAHDSRNDPGGAAAVPGRGRAWYAAFGAVAGLAATVCTATVLFFLYGAVSSVVDPAGSGWADTAKGLLWITVFGTGGTAVVAGGPSAGAGAVIGGVIGSRPIRWRTALAVAMVAAVVAAGLVFAVQRAVVGAENAQPSPGAVIGARPDPALSAVPAVVGSGAGGATGVAFLFLYGRLRAGSVARGSPPG